MGVIVNEGPEIEDGKHGSLEGRGKDLLIDLESFPLTSRAPISFYRSLTQAYSL